jgi:site-specific recombinase XerD
MKSNDKEIRIFWQMARDFLHVYLPKVRRLSPKTSESYKSSLEAFLDFLSTECCIKRENVTFDEFRRDRLKAFIIWLSDVRNLAPKTVNLRMTAIKSFLKYGAEEDISLVSLYVDAKSIKGQKTPKSPIRYLTHAATSSLLRSYTPDGNIKERRNRMILIFMYDTAARVQEISDVKTSDLHLDARYPFVTLEGKGSKIRNVPLMGKTVAHLKEYLHDFHTGGSSAPLFYSNRDGGKHSLSTDSIELLLKKAAARASVTCDDVPHDVHCHLIRKTRAMDLYREGISLPIIMQILGHENLSTTSGFYAFATLDMMYIEMEKAHQYIPAETPIWKDRQIMNILYSLD